MRGGMISSTLLHLGVLVILVIGLPDFGRDLEVAPPIPVEIATIDELTRPKPSKTAKPQPKAAEPEEPQEIPEAPPPPPRQAAPPPPPPPAPAPEPQQAELPKPAPPEPAPEPEPEPLPLPEPEAKPEPKEEVKNEEPKPQPPAPRPNRKPQVKLAQKPEKKKEEPKEDRLAAILKDVEKLKEEEPAPRRERTQEPPQPQQQASLSSEPITLSEKDAIRQQIKRCWNPPVGAPDAEDLVVELRLTLLQDGTVQRVQVVSGGLRAGNPFYKIAAEAAIRAVKRCSPLKMPAKKYSAWRTLVMEFDPSEMLGL